MSIQSPLMLLELAVRSLLSNKSRAILDLEDLPIELFPPLFVEAFSRGHTEVLKKMVQAWPFTCLPLGTLMRQPQPEMLQVALDGLDMLLAQQDRPRLPVLPARRGGEALAMLSPIWERLPDVVVLVAAEVETAGAGFAEGSKELLEDVVWSRGRCLLTRGH
ncbi:hypothetical protein GHT09_011018 [Marmota monax]|uniref:Uncharacterized protein n=1 Tax=Marmota monax TaxID=9995 RepID=A0A834QIK4_MARMO|nr:hypothetical protein GHT09_011018 [Marmota monax]